MDRLKNIEMGQLAIIVGVVSVIGWIVLDGVVPLVISIIGGSLIALRATMQDD